jgi:glycosyltransferase involved in cell wall biosynthesis
MNIAWFTPFSKKSAIGRCSQGIVTALAAKSPVDLCHFDNDETHAVQVPVRRFTSYREVDPAVMSRYDVIFYNFGNHLPFHKEIYEVSRRWPGVCILHDFVLQHFFAAYYFEYLSDPNGYVQVMERLYGQAGYSVAMASLSGKRIWESDDVVQYPLFEEAIRGAEGVITHSEFFRARVQETFAGPLRKISLPYTVDVASPTLTRKTLGVAEDVILMVTIGHVNPNKQIVSIIDALGSINVKPVHYAYAIVGSSGPDYRREVEAAIHRNGLEGTVRLVGEVSDEVLRSYLANADLCVNLRYPAMEGASASAIEEMLFGKPVIVSDIGFYAELPDDCVVKVSPQSQQDLVDVLNRLLSKSGEDERKRLGRMAEQYARSQFRSDLYARELMDFADEVRRARPLLGLADKLAGECKRIGVTADMPIVETLATEMDELFCGGRTSGQ